MLLLRVMPNWTFYLLGFMSDYGFDSKERWHQKNPWNVPLKSNDRCPLFSKDKKYSISQITRPVCRHLSFGQTIATKPPLVTPKQCCSKRILEKKSPYFWLRNYCKLPSISMIFASLLARRLENCAENKALSSWLARSSLRHLEKTPSSNSEEFAANDEGWNITLLFWCLPPGSLT